MYVRLTEGLGGPIPRIISTQSNLWRRMEPIDPRLGEPVTPTAACIAMPRWITPVKHFFFQRLAGRPVAPPSSNGKQLPLSLS
jgi:hypothetical protein